MLGINNLKIGTTFKYKGEPYEIVKAQHVKMGRGGAVLQTKIKNLKTGQLLEKNFKSSDKFEEPDLSRSRVNFLYQEDDKYYFMDEKSYEQFSLTKDQIGEKTNFIKEGASVNLLNFEDKAINIELPIKVDLKVKETPPGVRGDTAQGSATKEAKLETGYKIKVPLFIKTDDIIRVNTETGQYVERV
ncbi:MAG: elongation factor P [Patescibacteria group bacterium]|nr:elongation factor P [Patescibacteria group bacterium]